MILTQGFVFKVIYCFIQGLFNDRQLLSKDFHFLILLFSLILFSVQVTIFFTYSKIIF